MNNPALKKGLAIFIGVILFIVLALAAFRIFGTNAADLEPSDVVVANIDKNSARLSWATGVDTQAVVEYGTSPTALNFFAPEAAKAKSHTLDLTLLSPATTYYFDVRIGDKKYDNGGVPWTFTTKGVDQSVVVPSPTPVASGATTGTISPTPVQKLEIPDNTSSCTETDCAQIKAKLGKGCSTQDYFLCLNKTAGTPTPTASSTATPTLTPTPTP
ncbi:fibronectin type III domain-containing protein [Patescibacteria group bacterium]|nr:fibronectin type III domain-containing protein [Patescibacteria group bacterium]